MNNLYNSGFDDKMDGVLNKYRSIADRRWQSWGGFTCQLFTDEVRREYYKVNYKFTSPNSSVIKTHNISFDDESLESAYWGCPIKTVSFTISGIDFSHIDEFLSSSYVENTVFSNDGNCDLSIKPEIVISKYTVTNEEIYIETYWLFTTQSGTSVSTAT